MDNQRAWQEVEENFGLVGMGIQRFLRNPAFAGLFTFRELVTPASLAVHKAALTWDPSKGGRATFYLKAIRNALVDEYESIQVGVRTTGQRGGKETRRTRGGQTYVFLTPTGDLEPDFDDEEDGAGSPMSGLDDAMAAGARELGFEDDLVDRIDKLERAVEIREAVLMLPETERAIVIAHLWGHKTMREIAEDMGFGSRKTAERNYVKAMAHLRTLVEDAEVA